MLSKLTKHSVVSGTRAAFSRSSVRCAQTIPEWDATNPEVTEGLLHEMSLKQMESYKTVIPWFLKQMPSSYFSQVSDDMVKQHLKAVCAFHDITTSDMTLKIETKGVDGACTVTNLNNNPRMGLVLENLNNLQVPSGYALGSVKIFETADNSLDLQMFGFVPSHVGNFENATKEDAAAIFNVAAEIRAGEHSGDTSYPRYTPLFSEDNLTEYLKLCTPSYCRMGNPRRFLIQRRMYEKIRSTDKVQVHVEQAADGSDHSWITMAAANVLPDVMFRLATNILDAQKINVVGGHVDRIEDPENSTAELPGFVTMLRIYVDADKDTREVLHNTLPLLKRAKWYDEETTDFGLRRHPEVGVDRAEVITAICSMLHGPLCKQSPHAFNSIKSIIAILDGDKNFVALASRVADLFLGKFNPDDTIKPAEFTRRAAELRAKFEHANPNNSKVPTSAVNDAKILLNKMLDAVDATLRTNFYNADRYALSMRMDPTIMATDHMGESEDRPLPYGVYFSHGRHFNAFHCRFRDIARGGLRVVTPANTDLFASESSKQFDEAYNLAYAQQLKNKDIPEGGAKSVVLVNTSMINPDARFFAMRKAIRAFTDSCFDLMVEDSVADLVDYLNKDELLFFGPDEQVIASDVDWITKRAEQRNYPTPGAFMSSKPIAGFNHKTYGVTSEGITVFLNVALKKSLGIDPETQPFSVKITGGPDGDVAGNLMKILIRDYGSTCKIVGVADGFGVAEDPNGLNHTELMRLFEAGLPINEFGQDKLSTTGCMFDASTEIGAQRRNTMAFRVKADAFIPGGGRPGTINADNWKDFMDENGVPTSKLIVEGANLFNTDDARNGFFSKGIDVVKDSSANKCGVQTSSYEVQCSMLLSEEEFLENKTEMVEDVLVKLREAANAEAELLFREYKNYPGSLPEFSKRISNAINKVTDAIRTRLESVEHEDQLFKDLMPLVHDSLPKKLNDLAGGRVGTRLPIQYQRCIIASTLASKLVYQEGIHLVEVQPASNIADRAIAYYLENNRINDLVAELEGKDLGMDDAQKAEVLSLLKKGGARTSLDIF